MPKRTHVEAELLRVSEVAELLGLSVRAIWRMTSEGLIPGQVRIGASVRWSRQALVEWIDEQAKRQGA